MKNNTLPNPNTVHPIPGYDKEIYVKPTIKNPNIIVGDFTYIADSGFESHVTHHYEFVGDKLIIGKFCQIATGVEFVMNGANHQMNSVSTFPFYTLEGWDMDAPVKEDTQPLSHTSFLGDCLVWNLERQDGCRNISYDFALLADADIYTIRGKRKLFE